MKTESVVTIEIPESLAHSLQMSAAELRTELAISLFQQGKLSFGKAREMADMNFWQFQQLLGGRGISPHYDVEEYESDLKTLADLG